MRKAILTGPAKTALGYVDRNTAKSVAQFLTSDDPSLVYRGLQIASRNQKVSSALANTAHTLSIASGVRNAASAIPRITVHPQFPRPAGAEDQQNIPGPIPQQKDGGAVENKSAAPQLAHGGTVADASAAKSKTRFHPQQIGARQAPDGEWYIKRAGRYLRVVPRGRSAA